MENQILRQALEYLKRGLSVIPLVGKKPLIPWEEFQHRHATESEVIEWYRKWPKANVGIITGAISGVDVVDFDSAAAYKNAKERGFPETLMAKTGRPGACHCYCKHVEGVHNFQKRDDLPDTDLRAEGGYVVAPPSVHESGAIYTWINDLPLADLPEWIFTKDNSEKLPLKDLYKGVSPGSRNDTLARLVGSWAGDGLSLEDCLENARLWNQKNNPPLSEQEVLSVVKSICTTHSKKILLVNNVEVVDDVDGYLEKIFPAIEFPLQVLSHDLQVFVCNVSKAYNVLKESICAAILTIISGAIGNSVKVLPKADWVEPIFLWTMLVGPSGSGKSPLVNKLLGCVYRRQKEHNESNKNERKRYQVDVLNYKKQTQRSKERLTYAEVAPEEPKSEFIIGSDTTVEALAQMLDGSPRGIILHVDEVSGLIRSCDQYKAKGGNDRQRYLQLWNCQPWVINRVSKLDIYVSCPGCAIIGGIQPMVIPEIFKEQSFVDGLLPRFLISRVDRGLREFDDFSLTPEDIRIWEACLSKCYSLQLQDDNIKFSKEGLEAFNKFRNALRSKEKFLTDKAQVFIPKLTSYCVRLAGILHVLRGDSGDISAAVVEDAIKVVEYFAGQAMSFIYEYGKNQLTGIERELILALYKVRNKVKNGKVILSEITTILNSSLPAPTELSPEEISAILKKLGLETKPVGGYSHLIWQEAKINNLCMKASTSSTASTESLDLTYQDENEGCKIIVSKAEGKDIQCPLCKAIIRKVKDNQKLSKGDIYHIDVCLRNKIDEPELF